VRVSILLPVLLLMSCSVSQGPSIWDYMSPEHVRCEPKEQVKVCEQVGSRMLCQCYA